MISIWHKAKNTKVIPIACYPMNVCKFTQSELTELDNRLGQQASNKPLYMRRKDGGRGLNSLREVYEEKKLCVGWYMSIYCMLFLVYYLLYILALE